MPQILYTIGHSKHPIEKFLGLLKLHGIETIVDVRTHPMSRFNPQFNRKRLEEALAEQQIQYVFLGNELGGRPKGEQFYDEKGFVFYNRIAQSKTFEEGLKQLAALMEEKNSAAETKNVAVMCSEEDPESCHRKSLIGRALAKTPELTLRHIRGDGSAKDEIAMLLGGFSLDDDDWKSAKSTSKSK